MTTGIQASNSSQRARRLILANTLSSLTHAAGERYTPSNHVSALQELWLAEPGDILVTPKSPSARFVDAVRQVCGFAEDDVLIVSPDVGDSEPVPDALQRAELLDSLRRLTASRAGLTVRVSSLDLRAVELAHALGVCVEGYGRVPPGERTLDAVAMLNTKAGFRRVATELGVTIAPGRVCTAAAEADESIEELLASHEEVLSGE